MPISRLAELKNRIQTSRGTAERCGYTVLSSSGLILAVRVPLAPGHRSLSSAPSRLAIVARLRGVGDTPVQPAPDRLGVDAQVCGDVIFAKARLEQEPAQ